ncbi:Pycsar system effector family protein [Streptomyces sp. NPDC049040]|uniref:Pycsar system effector family protein n=1 Tax=Streptomyces sp. NPDC049040 TaxID=3365593 RepID=UPI0037209231
MTGSRLLSELRAETAHADNKASLLLGALSMTAGLLGGLLATRRWSVSDLSPTGTVLWWGAVTALAGSLLSLLLAVRPRYSTSAWSPGRPLTYFDDIRRAAGQGLLAEALDHTRASSDTGLLSALAENSRIVASKHFWIRVGLDFYCAGVLLLPVALALH